MPSRRRSPVAVSAVALALVAVAVLAFAPAASANQGKKKEPCVYPIPDPPSVQIRSSTYGPDKAFSATAYKYAVGETVKFDLAPVSDLNNILSTANVEAVKPQGNWGNSCAQMVGEALFNGTTPSTPGLYRVTATGLTTARTASADFEVVAEKNGGPKPKEPRTPKSSSVETSESENSLPLKGGPAKAAASGLGVAALAAVALRRRWTA
jgi:hypothetical protein